MTKQILFIAMMLLAMTLVGCGTNHEVRIKSDIPSTIEVIHKIDLTEFETRFTEECEEKHPDDQNKIDECVQKKLQDLLDLINSGSKE